jgi:threonine dehydratase
MFDKLKHMELPCGGDTLAEGIAVKEPGQFTSAVLANLVDDIVLVDEAHLEGRSPCCCRSRRPSSKAQAQRALPP